ncbi:MAG: 1-acyl-sn-glycerol-3-phosphate acyltransferase [Flavobacteriales bacterium]
MRFLYLLFWFVYKVAFRLYFRRLVVSTNSPYFYGRTIFISNHPGSLMDPLLIGSARRPIVFFMTRSDVFTALTKPLLWAVHMLPIYRQRDGVDTKTKNASIFEKTNHVLKSKRNILIFGEGFTDDKTPRHLFPIKKGALRIGFSALEFMEWKRDVFVQGLGINYMDPQVRRSDVVIKSGEPIRLNDFRAVYEENPNKALSEITRLIEKDMRSLLTDIHDLDWCEFHEQTMMLTRKGMNGSCYDANLTVEHRLEYSMKLAGFLNHASDHQKEQLEPLKIKMGDYFNALSQLGITENALFHAHVEKRRNQWLPIKLILLTPIFCLGLLHTALPYLWVKRFVEKALKRPVFWPGTKVTMAFFVVLLFNLPLVFWLLPKLLFLVDFPPVFWLVYFILIAPISMLFLFVIDTYKAWFLRRQIKAMDLSSLLEMRSQLLEQLNKRIPL